MHPAPSIILFTALSGVGFGLLTWLGLGAPYVEGWAAFWAFGLAYALSIVGLISSAMHLGHPERALKAFSQWRSSWLSREGVVSVAALLVMAPFAFGRVFLGVDLVVLGWIGAGLSLLTVLCTSMIYAQLKTVPRWNMALVPVLFMLFSIGGSGILVMQGWGLVAMLGVLTALQLSYWLLGDRKFAQAGHTPETATGLGRIGRVRLLESPHSGSNYLLKEMAYQVGRKHQVRLRLIALALVGLVPMAIVLVVPDLAGRLLGLGLHMVGLLASRWLFFAEAEHVVSLYYGKRA
jgi:sulfite dehydrogenase (quinone) subunit SoeC